MNMKKMQQESHLFGNNAVFVEELYNKYLNNENDVDESWREWFSSFVSSAAAGNGLADDQDHLAIQAQIKSAVMNRRPTAQNVNSAQHEHQLKQFNVLQLINSYRMKGHRKAYLDPLDTAEPEVIYQLTLAGHSLSEADLDTVFNTGTLCGADEITLREIIQRLEKTYCGTLASEYMYMESLRQKRWLQEHLEISQATPDFTAERKKRILDRIIAAENLEKYLHSRYVGQKRFSLEGGESLIPLMDGIIQQAGRNKTREAVIGMAHRGRLNVLINILGKTPSDLFAEFEGKIKIDDRSNYDVKYHQGFSSDIDTDSGPIHLSLAFNPSHLEIVDPVVEGSVRARQQRSKTTNVNDVLPILIHGDAAFAGQGVVMENFNMCKTRGYKTGGTIHIIVNNQIGFTTSNPLDIRSTLYCTEVARMVQAPIFHVNGDDPEACVYIAELAVKFRETFNQDIVIDMLCYRRYGHNEADEPSATQPMMYEAIRKHPRIVDIYAQRLIDEGFTSREAVDEMIADYRKALEQGDAVALNIASGRKHLSANGWTGLDEGDINLTENTQLDAQSIQRLGKSLMALPDGFRLHNRVKKIMDNRQKMLDGEIPCDWGFAETMAYAALLDEGYPVRLSGQDSERGTFFHRHAAVHDQNNGDIYKPLEHLSKDQPLFEVINSFLSEEAVLGFEYGYSSTDPNTLVVWEAQFGDFANGAQVVIDQFISSGETKWGRLNSLVMLLPHGYEGQGPEHSSARLERYLQLCAQHNMRVVYPTLPSQIFHLLRSQLKCGFRKPLIVMTPKSLLRHAEAVSPLSSLSAGGFQKVIPETDDINDADVKRLILCCGKIYYKLREVRGQNYDNTTAIVRVEQLYPFPRVDIDALKVKYPGVETVVWCQDEPRNQGAWREFKSRLNDIFNPIQVKFAGRISAASPAAGYLAMHVEQESRLVKDAFEL